jgi:hypothetical protein
VDDCSSSDAHKQQDHQSLVGQIIQDTVGSSPGTVEENTDSSPCPAYHYEHLSSFGQIIQHTLVSKQIYDSLDENNQNVFHGNIENCCEEFVEEVLPTSTIHTYLDTTNRDDVLQALHKPFADYVANKYSMILTNKDDWHLYYYPQLETLIRAFSSDLIWGGNLEHTMVNKREELWSTNNALLNKLNSEISFSPQLKCEVLKQAIKRHNHFGWPLRDKTLVYNSIQPVAAGFKKIQTIFEAQPDLSPAHLILVLERCLDVYFLQDKPEGFDKLWHAREGRSLVKFAQQLEKIVAELDIFAECPIGATPL